MLPYSLEGFANCTLTAEKNDQYNAAKSNIFITRGRFLDFFCDICNTASSDAPEIPLYVMMLDVGLNPCRIVATLALTFRRSNRSARSHPR
jgi:hypothetical protein